ncbi:hypothetical protein ACU4GR_32895 [Methylobacterium oryzae CBMB20]
MRREWLLVLVALGLAAAAAAIVYLSRPNTLTVAVGPQDGPEAALIEAYANALGPGARRMCSLKVVRYGDVRDSALALQRNKADLAVVRPDVFLPENGLTLAILHDEAMVIAAPEAGRSRRRARPGAQAARHRGPPQRRPARSSRTCSPSTTSCRTARARTRRRPATPRGGGTATGHVVGGPAEGRRRHGRAHGEARRRGGGDREPRLASRPPPWCTPSSWARRTGRSASSRSRTATRSCSASPNSSR